LGGTPSKGLMILSWGPPNNVVKGKGAREKEKWCPPKNFGASPPFGPRGIFFPKKGGLTPPKVGIPRMPPRTSQGGKKFKREKFKIL